MQTAPRNRARRSLAKIMKMNLLRLMVVIDFVQSSEGASMPCLQTKADYLSVLQGSLKNTHLLSSCLLCSAAGNKSSAKGKAIADPRPDEHTFAWLAREVGSS